MRDFNKGFSYEILAKCGFLKVGSSHFFQFLFEGGENQRQSRNVHGEAIFWRVLVCSVVQNILEIFEVGLPESARNHQTTLFYRNPSVRDFTKGNPQ